MKFLISLTLIMLLGFSNVIAQTINSEFRPSEEITKIKEGDLIEATIRVWPIENADFSQFKKLENELFFNAFYLAQITSLGSSANNADVVELKGVFVVKAAKAQPIFNFKYNDSLIELRLGDIKIEELKNKGQDFIILDQSLNATYLMTIILIASLLLLAIVIIKLKPIKEYILKMKPDNLKKNRRKYDELFRAASKREDFEKLYQEKEIWLNLLTDKAPAHVEFLKVLNQHQFKKSWGNEEYNEVRSSFDTIRRSFEK